MEWSDKTRQEYKQFMEANRAVKDPIERSLSDIAGALQKAWVSNRCLSCPIGELSAIAAATLTFYKESRNNRTVS
jgi:hypothetical protein